MLEGSLPAGQSLEIDGASQPGIVSKNGLIMYGTDGKAVSFLSCLFNYKTNLSSKLVWGCCNASVACHYIDAVVFPTDGLFKQRWLIQIQND